VIHQVVDYGGVIVSAGVVFDVKPVCPAWNLYKARCLDSPLQKGATSNERGPFPEAFPKIRN
jgi:hypothetical protein